MRKILFVDFDDTLVKSTEAFVKAYNKIYNDNAEINSIKSLDMVDECKLLGSRFDGDVQKDIKSIYASDEFWSILEPYEDALDSLKKLKKYGFQIILVSMGDPYNIEYKSTIAVDMFDDIFDEMMLIHQKRFPHSKSRVNMRGCFMVDDNEHVLRTTSATKKVVFGDARKWEPKYKGYKRVDNWKETTEYIISHFPDIKRLEKDEK